jgi:hypothetical protein
MCHLNGLAADPETSDHETDLLLTVVADISPG